MLVASEIRNPSRKTPPPAHEITPRRRLSTPAEHFLALVPTAWGICGAVWKYPHTEPDTHNSPFAARPASALLCRIVPPGMAVGELRRFLLRDHSLCDEVFGDGSGNFHPEVVPDWFPQLVRYLQAYYTTGLRDWTQPQFIDSWAFWQPRLDWSRLTPFQHQVLAIVAKIPHGHRWTYGQVAGKLGNPHAGRAVGAALRANPWPVLVPCHRVVGATGRMTGFSAPGGVATKQRMLALEDSGLLFP